MTKPLTIFLELFGLVAFVYGVSTASYAPIILGSIFMIAGAVGIRERMKVDRLRSKIDAFKERKP